MAGNTTMTKVWDISRQLDLVNGESLNNWVAGTGVTNLDLSTTHRTGQYSVTFDKSGTAAATGTITNTISKNAHLFALHKMKVFINLAALTNVVSVSFTIGTSATHNNIYTTLAASLTTGWNEIDYDCDSPTTVTGNGCNWYDIKYVAVTVTLGAAANTLTDILVDSISLFKMEESGGTVSENVNLRKVAGNDTVTGGASGLLAVGGNVASGATDAGNPVKVGGRYNTTLPTLTNGQRGDLQLNERSELKVAMDSDIQIGAVELKNAITDDRALISDANTARAATDHVLTVQQLAADGTVPPSGSLKTNAPFSKLTDGTSDLTFGTGTVKTVPSQVHDGTTGATVETGTKKALNVNITDGTNDMPTMDVNTRAGFQKITDGTNEASVSTTTIKGLNTVIGDGENTALIVADTADGIANAGFKGINTITRLQGYNGTTWDRVKATSGALNVNVASGSITADLDGEYDVTTNPDPDSVGTLVHENSIAGDLDKTKQTVRTTGGVSVASIASNTFFGKDVRAKMYGKSGTDEVEISATSNKLDVNASGTVAVSNTEFPLPSAQVTTLTPIAHPTEFPLPSAQVTTLTPPAAITGFATSANQLAAGHTVTPISATAGGAIPYKNLDVDESEDEVKGSAGQIYMIHAMNMTADPLYLKFYNAAAADVTVGTTVPTMTFPVPTLATTNGAGFTVGIPNGMAFGTAITIACTTGLADNDSGAPAANAMVVNLAYL